MRQSAKLNVYLGVRNLAKSFLPDHLRYLDSDVRRWRMNAFPPVSVVCGLLVFAVLAQTAAATHTTPHEVAGFSLLATLVVLGLVEHILMVMPVPADALGPGVAEGEWAVGDVTGGMTGRREASAGGLR